MSLEDKNDDEMLAYYLEIGVVNLEGMDENGEMIYSINQELAKDLAPELWQSHVDYVDRSLIELYEAGLVEIEYDENLQATLHLSPEGQKIAKEKGLVEIDPKDFKDIPND
ncbi:MAG: hypothetical protein EBT95_09295 [Verrucomicrobia bacterium]|jgi:hypothetical protein|nr:hypothetical protein [Verrucomicrobiota bacterium]